MITVDEKIISQLVSRSRQSDTAAFNELVDYLGANVFSFILKMVNNREIARDVYQETWIRAYRYLADYQDQGRFKSWILKIANNQCLNRLRPLKRATISISELLLPQKNNCVAIEFRDDRNDPEKIIEQNEALSIIRKIVSELPLKQRQVFLLRIEGEIPFKEIAEVLDRPLNTVLWQMRAALLTIRKQLKEIYGDV